MNSKKTIVPFALLALSFSLAACGNGGSSSQSKEQSATSESQSSSKELTILEKLAQDLEGGNAVFHCEDFANVTYIDKDTYIYEYLGDFVYSYYNSGLAFVEGVGYCSFIQVEDEYGEKTNEYALSNIQLPCDEKFDISEIMYTLASFGQYDEALASIEDGVATICDIDYAANLAYMINVEWPYSDFADSVTISAIEGGYEFTINFDTSESEEPLEPYEVSFELTNFGSAKHELYENFLANYEAVGLTEGFGDKEDILAEEAEPKMIDYLHNGFEWSVASVATYSFRAGLYLYDYGCGDKLESIKEDMIEMGYTFVPEYSHEGCYDFVIETIGHTSGDEPIEYVSGLYEVVVSYDSHESMIDMTGYPDNVYPEGAIIISFAHENYLEPGAMEKAMQDIEYYPERRCPSFSFEDVEYTGETMDDCGRFDTDLYFTFELGCVEDALVLFDRYIEAYDADEMFVKGEIVENEEGDPFFLGCGYTFEEYEGEELVNYCYVNFFLGVDEMFYGDDAVHCTYEVNYYFDHVIE